MYAQENRRRKEAWRSAGGGTAEGGRERRLGGRGRVSGFLDPPLHMSPFVMARVPIPLVQLVPGTQLLSKISESRFHVSLFV